VKLIAVKHLNIGVSFMDVKINWQLPGFSLQTGVMWFVVSFVEWKSWIRLKEMMHLRIISVGVHLARLRGSLQETFLLRLKHLNNSLAVAMTCAGLIWSTH